MFTRCPVYVAIALSDVHAANELWKKAADDLQTCTAKIGSYEYWEKDDRLQDAYQVCEIAEERYEEAWERWQLEQSESLTSLARNPTARDLTPFSPQSPLNFPPAERLLEGGHENLPTAGAFQHS